MTQEVLERLERFEHKFDAKLDDLTRAILTVARVEERQVQHNESMSRIWKAIDEVKREQKRLRGAVITHKTKIDGATGILHYVVLPLLLAALIGIGGYMFTQFQGSTRPTSPPAIKEKLL